MSSAILDCAEIEWRDNTPFSLMFDDIYYSRQDGLEETLYTFIEGNNLLSRWNKLQQNSFTLTELGFGTGLNCLATLHHWQKSSPNSAWLNYFSIEKFPLKFDDFKAAVANWPELNDLASELLKHYPLPFKGVWKIVLPKCRATLHLLWMDVAEALDHLHQNRHQTNAWYLDGFAPSKNPDLWRTSGFNLIRSCSSSDASFATFTAAGFVRRGLSDHGFEVKKRKGFGCKREMLIGQRQPSSRNESQIKQECLPWFNRGKPDNTSNKIQSVAVIGAGIAGCTTARKLADQGFSVRLFEEQSKVALGASGNSAGIFYPFLSKDCNPATQFFLHAYHQLLHDIDHYDLNAWVYKIGVLKLSESKQSLDKLLTTYEANPDIRRWLHRLDENQVSSVFSALTNKAAVHYPLSGFLTPGKLCQQLIEHPKIDFQGNTRVTQLTFIESQWQVKTKNFRQTKAQNHSQSEKFDAVVVCNSYRAEELLPDQFMPAIKVRGQTAQLSQAQLTFDLPNKVVCDDIYLIPQGDGQLYLGATFEQETQDPNLRPESHKQLLNKLQTLTGHTLIEPGLNDDWSYRNSNLANGQPIGRVGFRFCSVDRLPFTGPVPDTASYANSYRDLWKGKPVHHYPAAKNLQNLYVNIAHGARGITSSFVCADVITSYITRSSMPLPENLRHLIHPARFLIKELKKPANARLPGAQQIITQFD